MTHFYYDIPGERRLAGCKMSARSSLVDQGLGSGSGSGIWSGVQRRSSFFLFTGVIRRMDSIYGEYWFLGLGRYHGCSPLLLLLLLLLDYTSFRILV